MGQQGNIVQHNSLSAPHIGIPESSSEGERFERLKFER